MTVVLKHLPLLQQHKDSLEKCVYCPKLCRDKCPVSNAEPNETLIPWGKMSTSYFMGRGDIAISPEPAEVAWACSDCFACRERCDHKNLVGRTLFDARANLHARGAAPEPARRVGAEQAERAARLQEVTRRIRAEVGPAAGGVAAGRGSSHARLLVGCGYLRSAPREAALAVRVASELLGMPVNLVDSCCGYPLLAAGDRPGFMRAADAFAREVATAHPLVVLDPGCARTLADEYPRIGVEVTRSELLLDVAGRSLDRLRTLPGLEPPRYHDPCQLGRGMGRYDVPRAIIERVVGQPAREFERARERAECAGSGGLLPITRPAGSARIADSRIAEHERLGGGALVTACGSSLRRFRKSGAAAGDLISYLAAGLGLCDLSAPGPGADTVG